MLHYVKQIEIIKNEVKQQLKRIGKDQLSPILPILGAVLDRRYRNNLEVTISNRRYLLETEIARDREIIQNNDVASHVPRMYDKVIDIYTFHLMEEPTNLIRNTIRDFAKERNYSYYDIKGHHGWLRTLIIRIATTG